MQTIKAKLTLLGTLAIAGLIIVTLLGSQGISTIKQDGDLIKDNYLVSIINLSQATEQLYSLVIAKKNHITSKTDAQMQHQEQKITTALSGSKGADAFEQMEQLLKQMMGRGKEGAAEATRAAASLDTITAAITTINDMNTQIASASKQQSGASEEINRSISTISEAVEANFEGGRHTTASSRELAKLTRNLQSLVSQFRI